MFLKLELFTASHEKLVRCLLSWCLGINAFGATNLLSQLTLSYVRTDRLRSVRLSYIRLGRLHYRDITYTTTFDASLF
jgi:hypothetical protein